MNSNKINRTGERILGIIGAVFNVLVIFLMIFLLTSLSGFEGSPEQQQLEQEIMNDPALSDPEEAQMVVDAVNVFIGGSGIVFWVIIAILVISTIFAILAIVNLKGDRNPRLAGLFFILAGVFAGLLSITSILFYIAAIMCFARKPPLQDDMLRKDDTVRREDETPYRPL
ncbi:DUF4064 domain-containing protein [Planococcus salinus]|uniref:DUF4064 domain-containing protein n=1 Tax=Planococcus salinus TaxID=1848460 RepID=A0A3M8P5G9_9BACL|nr:DUF4064 domain-containing protein [Planococcus salinus]RNF38540.1 DUF4064 domain-containing protein [Planococcus salinus]